MTKRRVKSSLIVIDGQTGEGREYVVEDDGQKAQAQECIEEHFEWLARAVKNLNRSRQAQHIRLMQQKSEEYLTTPGFQGSYSAVFLLALAKAKYGGRVPLTKEQIGERLGYSRQTVARALTHLIDNGMLTLGEHEGRPYYFLPTVSAEKGQSALKGTKDAVRAVKARAETAGFRVIPGGKR